MQILVVCFLLPLFDLVRLVCHWKIKIILLGIISIGSFAPTSAKTDNRSKPRWRDVVTGPEREVGFEGSTSQGWFFEPLMNVPVDSSKGDLDWRGQSPAERLKSQIKITVRQVLFLLVEYWLFKWLHSPRLFWACQLSWRNGSASDF